MGTTSISPALLWASEDPVHKKKHMGYRFHLWRASGSCGFGEWLASWEFPKDFPMGLLLPFSLLWPRFPQIGSLLAQKLFSCALSSASLFAGPTVFCSHIPISGDVLCSFSSLSIQPRAWICQHSFLEALRHKPVSYRKPMKQGKLYLCSHGSCQASSLTSMTSPVDPILSVYFPCRAKGSGRWWYM